MTLTVLERQLMNRLRPMGLEARKREASWTKIAKGAIEPGNPALELTFDMLTEHIPVERWRSGNPRLGMGEIVSDTYQARSFFYGSEFNMPGWETWLYENVAQQNGGTADFGGDLNSERRRIDRRIRRHQEAIERAIDDDYFNGNSKIDFPGIINLDASPTDLHASATLKTADGSGRRAFLDVLTDLKSEAATDLTRGARLVLAIGHDAEPYLDRRLGDGASFDGQTLRQALQGVVSSIVPVQNTAMNGKAMLHYVDRENVEVYDMTPGGVIVRAQEDRIEGLRVRMFRMWTAVEHRAKSVQVITGLLA